MRENESNEENANVGSDIADKVRIFTMLLEVEDLVMNEHIQMSITIFVNWRFWKISK